MNRRFMMMGVGSVKKSRLPEEFQEVEYIESLTTNNYIDTGISPSSDTKIILEYSSPYQSHTMFGSYKADVDSRYLIDNWNFNIAIRLGTVNYISSTVDMANRNIVTIENNQFYVNGTKYGQSSTQFADNGLNLYLFARNANGVANDNSTGKVYGLKIYKDGVNIDRDFVPCYRKSDNVVGLYDTINGVFYTNSGTGTFTKGGDVV